MKFKLLLETIIQEFSSDAKKKKGLNAMANRETSFAGWVAKYSNEIKATHGNLQKLLDLIDHHLEQDTLRISERYYNTVVDKLKHAYSDDKRLQFIYNSMLSPQGLGTGEFKNKFQKRY